MLGPRLWLFMFVLLAGVGLMPIAENLSSTQAILADELQQPAEDEVATEGVLVLRDGPIVTGKIVRSGNVYQVQGPNGRWSVPEDLVKLRCASLLEAYGKLRVNAQSQRDAHAHLALARWCLTNHLDKEARQEAVDALTLEPDREDAKRLLRNVDETLLAKQNPSPPRVHDDPMRAARQAAAANDDAVSLGGLSRELALRFSRRIQPILVNNCTSAGCHGRDSQTGLRLYKVTPGKDASRYIAERNLAEVLQQIDANAPRSSPLLTASRGNHGRRGRPVFAGPRGEDQSAELQKWITAVAREGAIREKLGDQVARRKNAVEPVSASHIGHDRSAAGRDAGSSATNHSSKESSVGPAPLPAQGPLPPARDDPFAPALFNRGGGSR